MLQGLHVCQLMGYGQLDEGIKLVTHNSVRTMQLKDYGNRANLIILPAEDGFDALCRQVPSRYLVRHGRVIAETKSAETAIHLNESERVDFKR